MALQITIRHTDIGEVTAPVAEFRCAVFGLEDLPVVVAADDIPVPADRWEFRASGIWTEHICEVPFVHWSYGLEAFGLAIDEPDELLGRGYGDRVPVGWELEFEGEIGNVESCDDIGRQAGADHQVGMVDGLLLGAAGELAIRGPAMRSHRWGPDVSESTAHRAGSLSSAPDRSSDRGPTDGPAPSVALPMGFAADAGPIVWTVRHRPGLMSWSEEAAAR